MAAENKLILELLEIWKHNNKINLELLKSLGSEELSFISPGIRRRSIAQQFAHMHHTRYRWLLFNRFETAEALPVLKGSYKPSKKEIQEAIKSSGKAVVQFLKFNLSGKNKIKYFGGSSLRWAVYLITHESHHRGQIIFALKQSGFQIPDAVSVKQVWESWYWNQSKNIKNNLP